VTEVPESWITELRGRLGAPPPRRLAGEGARAAVLVPLFVDAGALWVLLGRRSRPSPLHAGDTALAGRRLEEGEEEWDAAAEAAEKGLGIDQRLLLPLGALDEVMAASGMRITPWVAAVPHGVETEPGDGIEEVFGVPLFVVADPRMREEREVEVDGSSRRVTVLHLGRRTVWGVVAEILLELLERLGLEGDGATGGVR
jgi:hypothetical protein